MNKDTRISNIQAIIDRDKTRTDLLVQEIMWEKQLRPEIVHNIPLSNLVYNKYNGRILSRTKSLEKQNLNIDIESDRGRDLIEGLLWDSKKDRNNKTLKSIQEFGQQKVGIITRDGVIIDGNRRAMLLNKIDRLGYFKAIVLPVTLEENPIEIERLETTYQMGEDEKVDYNPIEKYLKAKQIFDKLIVKLSKDEAIKNIADWMGQRESTIQDYLDVMKTMDEYLEYHEYEGIYTQLDGREDQFISLTNWLNNFYGETSKKAGWSYKNSDVDDLKIISFDYIRARYEGKEFRYLAHGLKGNHFFGDKEIWKSFSKIHFDDLKHINESSIDFNSTNLKSHLDKRDSDFSELVMEKFKENVNNHYQKLRNRQSQDEPVKLLSQALDKIESINTNSKNFAKPESLALSEKLATTIINSLQKKSPIRILSHVVTLLEDIEIDNLVDDEKTEALKLSKRIQQIGYDINKSL
ncbi:conserved hypothetical protein [Flavobacterium sp. 9AF]|uniref:hypothetical protein n=1 Tax=Flavobacterium sp. 9AF TaxID=2653142 RepID=UPI0012F156F8|nr:hypothetical protein [Flavobacterium sp. 9AF]VXB30634.1 conserved hypothetical protein [Flavobacterium sp. 9AF]